MKSICSKSWGTTSAERWIFLLMSKGNKNRITFFLFVLRLISISYNIANVIHLSKKNCSDLLLNTQELKTSGLLVRINIFCSDSVLSILQNWITFYFFWLNGVLLLVFLDCSVLVNQIYCLIVLIRIYSSKLQYLYWNVSVCTDLARSVKETFPSCILENVSSDDHYIHKFKTL